MYRIEPVRLLFEDEDMKSNVASAVFILLVAVMAIFVVRRMRPDEDIWPFAIGLFVGVGICLLWDYVIGPARARRKSRGN